MSEVVWQDPPKPRHNRAGRPSVYAPLLEQLMVHPKRWARLCAFPEKSKAYDVSNYLAQALRLKNWNRVPAGKWEFTARSMDDGGGEVYARYLGPEDEA